MSATPIVLDFKQINDRQYFNSSISGYSFGQTEVRNNQRPNGTFSAQYNQAILSRPLDYYLAVQRLSVPTSAVPVFVPDIYNLANSATETVYNLGLRYNNVSYSKRVQWVSQNPSQVGLANYYWLYNYTPFVAMINKTFADIFAMIPSPPVGAEPPYFIFNPSTKLFSCVAQKVNYGTSAVTPIEIHINYPTLILFQGMSADAISVSNDDIDLRLVMYEVPNCYYQPIDKVAATPPAYLINTQGQASISSWTPLKSVQVTSSSLPIVQEYVPSPQNTGVLGGTSIIKDFIPLLRADESPSSGIDFVNEGPYQLINLTGEYPITKIDITCFWVDKFGRQYPIEIPYNATLSIKLAFIKKSTFTS